MEDISSTNKRIAKNTLALYIRTFVTMIVGLYMGRIMLHALGVEDYGINSVVGGIVSMSALITSTMSAAISRYITYALGKGDHDRLITLFSTAVNAQIVMSILVAIVLEIVGVWFLNTEASIPEGRLTAANWVLQCGIVTLIITLISTPYNATIIAHEKMSVYAYVSIADALMKLGICFLIQIFDNDRLILFAFLHIIQILIVCLFYYWYCGKYFEEAKYSIRVFDKSLMKELTVFSGWNLINNGAYVFATQGVNMLVNVYFGVVYNASRAVAMQVNHAAQSFVNNFTVAFQPQITKSYAIGEIKYAVNLVNRGTKFTWLMMFVFIVPICCEAETLLQLWLGEVPDMAPMFLRFAMVESLAVASGQNLFKLIQADGNVKAYTIHAAITAGLIFPLAWLSFYLGAPVWFAYLLFIIVFFFLNFVRFYDLKKLMFFSIRQHIIDAIIPCIIVSLTSFILPLLITFYFEPSVIRFLINVPIAVLWTCLCCVLFGLTKNERFFFLDKIKLVFKKIRK